VARVPVRNAATVAFARHYGLTVATCVPADPATKGGSEACVRVAKADLVPTETNLCDAYGSFAELEAACAAFCDQVNTRAYLSTRRVPVEMLAEEQQRLHPLPAAPFTAAFGVMRTVGLTTPMVSFEVGQYSVPHTLAGQRVWVRRHGEQVVIVHVGERGPREVARHAVTTPGTPRLDDAHFPPAPSGVLSRPPRARSDAEAAFLAIGAGAVLWLTEAAATGATRVRTKMAEAAWAGPAAPERRGGPGAGSGRHRGPLRRR
jgi:hypothetical protein